MGSRWLKHGASPDEELTMAILGLTRSSSVSPSARHWARRVAQRGAADREVAAKVRHAFTSRCPYTDSCHGMTNRFMLFTTAYSSSPSTESRMITAKSAGASSSLSVRTTR